MATKKPIPLAIQATFITGRLYENGRTQDLKPRSILDILKELAELTSRELIELFDKWWGDEWLTWFTEDELGLMIPDSYCVVMRSEERGVFRVYVPKTDADCFEHAKEMAKLLHPNDELVETPQV